MTHLEIQEKKELTAKEENTVAGKFYVPYTDIYETSDVLTVVMEIPGIKKDAVDIRIEKNQLTVNAEIDAKNYANFRPVYTEYNVGHFTRSFALSNKVAQDKIDAAIHDGVLTLRLPKAEEVKARKITVH